MLNQHQTVKREIERLNKSRPFEEYLIPFLGDKKWASIADIGSGPFPTIGQYLDGVDLEIYLLDKQDFSGFYKRYNVLPPFPIEYQDMEKLTYPDNYFDIVHCRNTLDHTKDVVSAVKEMIRVCKIGGWVYINCWLDQLSTGFKHHWDAKEDGVFINKKERVDLKDFGFSIEHIDKGGERRYNQLIATLQK